MPARIATTIQFLTAILAVASMLAIGAPSAAGQGMHDFAVTVDSIPACSPSASVTGTVTLTGLTAGDGFTVQILGDGVILDSDAFEEQDGYRDGTYDWSVEGDLSGIHNHVELGFSIQDGDLNLIRQQTQSIDGQCEPDATPAGISGLPIAGAGRVFTEDRVEMLAFVAVILGVLAILTALDRQKGR